MLYIANIQEYIPIDLGRPIEEWQDYSTDCGDLYQYTYIKSQYKEYKDDKEYTGYYPSSIIIKNIEIKIDLKFSNNFSNIYY